MSNPDLRLALDLHPVGPRVADNAPETWVALNAAAAYDALAHGPGSLVSALMPDTLFDEAAGSDKHFELFLFSAVIDQSWTITAVAPAATAFSALLDASIEADAVAMADKKQLVFGWDGDHMAEEGDVETPDPTDPDAPAILQPHPWFGIASAMAALPASLAVPLRARWYLQIDLDPVRAAAAADPRPLLAVIAPHRVYDANRKVHFALDLKSRVVDPDGRVTLSYDAPGEPTLLAYSLPLAARELFKGGAGDLKTYWLAVADSRANSLAEIDELLRKNGDPKALAALPSVDVMRAALRPANPGSPITAAMADAFRLAAAHVAARLSDDARRNQAYEFAAKVLATPKIVGVDDLFEPAAQAIAEWWSINWAQLEAAIVDGRVAYADAPPIEIGHFALDSAVLATAMLPAVHAFLKLDGEAGPVKPGEGIDFVVGPPEHRLMGYDPAANQTRSTDTEMAQIGLLVRRSSDGDFTNAPWRIVTAGQPVLDESHILHKTPWGSPATMVLPADDTIAINGIALAFKDGVLRNDDTYRGQLMVGPSALSFLHADQGTGADNPIGWVDPGEVVYASAGIHKISGWEQARAPALRYADTYQLAAFVKDRGGGLPREIAPVQPWQPDLAGLSAPAATTATIHFKRRVPLGALNLKPGERVKGWPALAADVVLLAGEWWEAQHGKGQSPPVLLFSEPTAPGSTIPSLDGTLARYRFVVEPPRIDEHTLQCWAMPPVNSATANQDIARLMTEYARIAREREALQADPQALADRVEDLLPHDPAASAVLIDTQMFGPDGNPTGQVARKFHRFVVPDMQKPFSKAPLEIEMADTPPTAGLHITPPAKGHFATVTISLLCEKNDHDRFDADALAYKGMPTHDEGGVIYVVHPGETILVETATMDLPRPADLYAALSLAPEPDGLVAVDYAGAVSNLAYVDRFELRRQRWVWRNLPYVTEGDPADLERRLASGLPIELAATDQDTRDSADEVIKFDLLTEIDRGFVERPRHRARWPRDTSGHSLATARLLSDPRDAQSLADYLRYSLSVTSRYAGVLPLDRRSVIAEPPKTNDAVADSRGPWRRVAVRNSSASELRPVNILAVLPLTASLLKDPVPNLPGISPDATPHLVIVDEIWFREYGPGEVLRARLALEDIEIGDDLANDNPRPVRYGPLPHKHIEPRLKRKDMTDEAADKDMSLCLTLFGPFGYSLDRSGNQALANASAFVMYLPADVGPYWSAAIQFRRVLRGIGSDGSHEERVGPLSSPHLVYSVADSRKLARSLDGNARLEITINAAHKPAGPIAFHSVDADLCPYQRDGKPADIRVRKHYRYVLIIGRTISDGGHGIDAFIPEQALWLRNETSSKPIGSVVLDPGSPCAGYILEVELDHPFDEFASPLEVGATTLAELFRGLLQTRHERAGRFGIDGLGRIGRVSDPFTVVSVGP
ncbi:hypothetical protein [Novosphingobium resinovorum]|uniref:Uncharacterized protein n=1 Tax=Novosphingobium resinovorum TaxID=158500 RepID=A0A1D8A590_9SPHN|nr:hypothetical protein [Novosphingobium resinovorum]AOR77270.1 hypothetical protein BES08_11315 [Novosphingobium resinovorum]